jgi:hypothetical protein
MEPYHKLAQVILASRIATINCLRARIERIETTLGLELKNMKNTNMQRKVNCKGHKICSWSSANHKGYLRLCWGTHKGSGLFQS